MQKIRGRVAMPGLLVGGGTVVNPTPPVPSTGVSQVVRGLPVRSMLFTMSNFVISMSAANDFGSAKICDLPNSNLIVLGAAVDLTGTMLGFTADVGTGLDLSIGTVATASALFSNAGEKDIVPKIDGTGAGAAVTVAGANSTTEKLTFIAAGPSNALYVNASSPVATASGTLTLNGTVEVFYIDTSI